MSLELDLDFKVLTEELLEEKVQEELMKRGIIDAPMDLQEMIAAEPKVNPTER
jgi:hypothetical protein